MSNVSASIDISIDGDGDEENVEKDYTEIGR